MDLWMVLAVVHDVQDILNFDLFHLRDVFLKTFPAHWIAHTAIVCTVVSILTVDELATTF